MTTENPTNESKVNEVNNGTRTPFMNCRGGSNHTELPWCISGSLKLWHYKNISFRTKWKLSKANTCIKNERKLFRIYIYALSVCVVLSFPISSLLISLIIHESLRLFINCGRYGLFFYSTISHFEQSIFFFVFFSSKLKKPFFPCLISCYHLK